MHVHQNVDNRDGKLRFYKASGTVQYDRPKTLRLLMSDKNTDE